MNGPNPLRDQFAMAALTGIMATITPQQVKAAVGRGEDITGDIAKSSYVIADAMLAERNTVRGANISNA